MPWEQCERCWKWFDLDIAKDNGKVYYNGYEIGLACDMCKDKILKGESK